MLAAVIWLAACSNPPESAPATPPARVDPSVTGTVTGQVVVDGDVPASTVIRLDSDPKCLALADGEERRTEQIVVGDDNGLQNVFVYVKSGLPPGMYPVPAQPVVLDQQRCRYVPRVLGIQVGQPLLIRNSDPLLHNVRSESAINEPFDIGTPVQGVETQRTFVTREVMVPLKCNVHSWMNAYIGVVEHPYYAVSGEQGRFTLPPLPPGTYTIDIWHERFGTQTQEVTVTAGQTSAMTFTFKAA